MFENIYNYIPILLFDLGTFTSIFTEKLLDTFTLPKDKSHLRIIIFRKFINVDNHVVQQIYLHSHLRSKPQNLKKITTRLREVGTKTPPNSIVGL